MRLRQVGIVRVVLVLAVGAATGGLRARPAGAETIELFRSPTGSISCLYVSSPAQVSCEIADYRGPVPKRPADCELDWVAGASVTRSGRVRVFGCQGDTIRDPAAKAIAYGSAWKRGAFTCASNTTGMRCTAASGHGFNASRRAITTF